MVDGGTITPTMSRAARPKGEGQLSGARSRVRGLTVSESLAVEEAEPEPRLLEDPEHVSVLPVSRVGGR